MKNFKPRFRAVLACAFAASACCIPRAVRAADAASNSAQVKSPIGEIAFQTLGLGTQSGCARAAKMLISTEKEWRRVWSIHTMKSASSPLPIVDWSHQAVVALLGGQGNASVQINQIVRAPGEVVVFFDKLAIKDSDVKTSAKATRAFHFALIEKPQAPLRFQDLSNPECATCVLKPGE